MNLDDKVQTDKEMRKHGDMLSASTRAIVCGPSNCGKTNVLISLLESPHGIFGNVHILEIAATAEISIPANLFPLIEEIDYFIFFNKNNIILSSEALLNSISLS